MIQYTVLEQNTLQKFLPHQDFKLWLFGTPPYSTVYLKAIYINTSIVTSMQHFGSTDTQNFLLKILYLLT